MQVGDRISLTEGTLDGEFWKIRGLDENSIGTIVHHIGSNITEVRWDNGTHSFSKDSVLKLVKDKNIPLPNRKFIELKQRKQKCQQKTN